MGVTATESQSDDRMGPIGFADGAPRRERLRVWIAQKVPNNPIEKSNPRELTDDGYLRW
jgi:hypothetical protein